MAVLTAKGLQRQKDILAAADDLFRQNGYDNTTLRMIAQSVGISCGHLEHYFKEKKDLLNSLSEILIQNLWKAGEKICSEEESTPFTKYIAAVHLLFLVCSKLPDLKQVMFEYVKNHDNQMEFSKLFSQKFLEDLGDEKRNATDEQIRIAVDMAFAAQLCCVNELDEEKFTDEMAKKTSTDHIKILFLLLGKNVKEAEKICAEVNEKIEICNIDKITRPFTKSYRWYVIEENEFEV